MKAISSMSMAITLFGAAACATEPVSPDRPRSTVSACDPNDIQNDYFGGQLTRTPEDEPGIERESQLLRGLRELPLYCDRAGFDEEYRLQESPFLHPYSDVVRVSRSGDRYRIVAATTLPQGGRLGGKQRVDRQMTTPEWTKIVKAIEPLQLWNLPPPLPPLPPSPYAPIILYHGSSYVVEGRKGSQYRAMRMRLKDLQKVEFLSGAMFSAAVPKTETTVPASQR